MSEISELLKAINAGDQTAKERLMPLVYDEMRSLAARNLAKERPGQTLQATALVHEAYIRLVGEADAPGWNSRGHFFSAAAITIRRVLVDNARRKQCIKRGSDLVREPFHEELLTFLPEPKEDILALDEALQRLTAAHPQAANLIQLLYFSGLTLSEAADTLNISTRSAGRLRVFAHAWQRREIE
ncbi:MAG: ECF-type sigma factor [bacterium]|nr:ECF-type sigma factor [bacterium]